MKYIFRYLLTLFTAITFFVNVYNVKSQGLYFPPVNPNANWDTISPSTLGWCVNEIIPLYNFLEQENTKGFIVLIDGKIVIEKYFGTFTKDSVWYWASAGKTLTSFLIGQAQESGYLSINDVSSKFLGKHWTTCTDEQENKITIRNQLTMTTGLNDGVSDNHCLADSCLNYIADAGTRWAYHNAPYTLLEKVLTKATGQNINLFTANKLKNLTGISGSWFTIDYDNVFFSKARSMARFGLLIQNKGIWNNDTLLKDKDYFNQMVNPSQTLNNSYGYLWWLNGKNNYMLPTSQIIFPGSFAPFALQDMIAALGKNGQILSISPSKRILFVRIGNQSDNAEVTTILCNKIWQKLNAVICSSNSIEEFENNSELYILQNSSRSYIKIESPNNNSIDILDISGKLIVSTYVLKGTNSIDISKFQSGVYFLKFRNNEGFKVLKFVK